MQLVTMAHSEQAIMLAGGIGGRKYLACARSSVIHVSGAIERKVIITHLQVSYIPYLSLCTLGNLSGWILLDRFLNLKDITTFGL